MTALLPRIARILRIGVVLAAGAACAPLPALPPTIERLIPPATATSAPTVVVVFSPLPRSPTLPSPTTTHPATTATHRNTAAPTPTSPHTHTPTPTPAPPTLTLLFTGDINPGRCPAQIALRLNDFTAPYHIVGETLRAADITIGSLDGSISDQSPPSPCPETMNLIGPSRTVEGLRYAGFDVLTVATNHAKDCGTFGWNCQDRAFRDTLANLAHADIAAAGGGETLRAARAPVIVERQGVVFAFLGVSEVGAEMWARDDRPGTAPLSDAALPGVLEDIAAAREQADVVVVLAQWGVEYAEKPSERQRAWARAMAEAGAALIIGNHAHVVQPLEVFGAEGTQALAAYALGNFVFDQGPWRTRQGALLEVAFEGAQLKEWRLLPIHIRSLHQPHWADEAEAREILERMPVLDRIRP